MNRDLASVVGLLLKACPILKKNIPHESWLEYLHTTRFVVKKLSNEECDIAARSAGCFTIEEAVTIAETGKIKKTTKQDYEHDIIVLALRLLGEDSDTLSPEVAEVMMKWEDKVKSILAGDHVYEL